jgi:hypothetical protein
MSDSDKTQTKKQSTASKNEADDLGASELQAAWDEANEQGYFGTTPDEKDNSEYTVEGVTKGKK